MRPLAFTLLAALLALAACHAGSPSNPPPLQYGPPPGVGPQGGYYPPPAPYSQGGYPAPAAYQPPLAAPLAPPPVGSQAQSAPAVDPFSAILRSLGSGPASPGWSVPTSVPAVPMGGLPWPFPSAPGVAPQPQPQPAPMLPPAPAGPSARAIELANTINNYRLSRGLPAIPISRALTYVAETHVRDLDTSPPRPGCNGHSWTDRGQWTACCYTPDHAQASCMWNKPAELARFKSTGYEIAVNEPGRAGLRLDAQAALELWKSSPAHHAVILNQEGWAKKTWRAMGAGITDNHAAAWFAEDPDPQP